MPEGTTTRKLVRQEWKPLAGGRVTRFVAMPASNTVPGAEWTDDLPGGSEVVNEVIGYAELESQAKFPGYPNFEEFARGLEEDAVRIITWENGWGERAESILDPEPVDESENQPPVDRAVEAIEEVVEEHDPEGVVDEKNSSDASSDASEDSDEGSKVVTTDGSGGRMLVEFDSDDEPYRLPGNADSDDLRKGVIYEAVVNGVEGYGIFVTIPETHANRYDDVSGIVHQDNMGLRVPSDFEKGDRLAVELIEETEKGLSFSHADDLDDEEGLENLFPKEALE